MKRIFLAFIVAITSVVLAATVFSKSVFIGPLLITLSLFAGGYGLVVFYQIRQKSAEILLEFILNFLMWP
ncbi:hypothetical protein [Streptococcus plurextorum]|uniref:hypothetical protein n=1 Tax=Streptococcus plurextorum TaxID=456876 RepID=UPI0003F66966|nr:hypothetical protein [Streptococcus plurextorum]